MIVAFYTSCRSFRGQPASIKEFKELEVASVFFFFCITTSPHDVYRGAYGSVYTNTWACTEALGSQCHVCIAYL